jgi:tRNA(Ile)-lysidine synthase
MKLFAKRGLIPLRRTLLEVSREEIDSYRMRRKVAFREDLSNAETRHTRNKFRHQVIPAIEAVMGPGVRKAVLRAAEILRAEDEWMAGLVPEPGDTLQVKSLRGMHPAARSRLVLTWLRGHGIADAGLRETKRVLSMLDADGPAKVNLPGDLHARRQAIGTLHSQTILDNSQIGQRWQEWLTAADRPSIDGLNTFVVLHQ